MWSVTDTECFLKITTDLGSLPSVTWWVYETFIKWPETFTCRDSDFVFEYSTWLMGFLTMQIVRERPQWHLVDAGRMSESMLGKPYLRDDVHPKPEFTSVLLDTYLNLHAEFGRPLLPTDKEFGLPAEFDGAKMWQERTGFWHEHHEKEKSRFNSSPHLTRLYSWHCICSLICNLNVLTPVVSTLLPSLH